MREMVRADTEAVVAKALKAATASSNPTGNAGDGSSRSLLLPTTSHAYADGKETAPFDEAAMACF